MYTLLTLTLLIVTALLATNWNPWGIVTAGLAVFTGQFADAQDTSNGINILLWIGLGLTVIAMLL